MESLTYECGGMKLIFEQRQGAELYVNMNEFDDSGAKGVFEQYKIPGMDGGITTTMQFDRRTMSFKFIHDLRNANTDRIAKIIDDIFNPKIEGKLTYKNDIGQKRHILCRPQRSVLCTARRLNTTSYTVEFTADIPYWRSKDQIYELDSITHIIKNQCKFTIYPIVIFTSKGYIANETTGEKLEIARDIDENNERIVYDCGTGEIQLLKKQNDNWVNIYDGELIFSNISNRLSLTPGDNGFVATAKGTLKYNFLYMEKG